MFEPSMGYILSPQPMLESNM
uniref:Uncharacterized protein n=1 Tax=Rhizophora mucronata TaxID=61149 RepID=A0A2P2PS06_RHIMU